MGRLIEIKIDTEGLASGFANELKQEVQAALQEGVRSLAAMTHAKTAELAQQRLRSTRKKYVDELGFEEVAPGLWVVSLGEPALWIEEGRKAGSMLPDLLRRNYKIAKDGTKYRVIPFEHTAPPSSLGPKALEIVQQLKGELKSRGIPFKKVERGPDGKPIMGVVHRIDIPSKRPTRRASTEALAGVTVVQRMGRGGNVRRDILTFRVASEKHAADGRWVHPGSQGHNLMDLAAEWALDVWERDVMPEILERYLAR